MPDDLHRSIARAMTPSAIGLLARNLGETPGAVRTALDGAVASTFRVLLAKSASDGGAEEVLGVVRDSRSASAGLLTGSPPGFEARLRAADPADPLATSGAALDRIFSGRTAGLAAHLASFSRIKPESAAALLRLGAKLVLASLDDAEAVKGGTAGLRRLLRAQEPAVERITPRGFDPDLGDRAPAGRAGPRGWLPWLLTALALLLLAVVALPSCGRDEPGAVVETVPPAEAVPQGAPEDRLAVP